MDSYCCRDRSLCFHLLGLQKQKKRRRLLCRHGRNDGGFGQGVGVLVNGSKNAQVVETNLVNNHATSVGKGYGLLDTANSVLTLIMSNFAFGNSTANYNVNANLLMNVINQG